MQGGWAFVCATAIVSVTAACSGHDTFVCTSDSQCVRGELRGTCQTAGLCSFPDRDCPSGHRYGAYSGSLAGTCVGDQPLANEDDPDEDGAADSPDTRGSDDNDSGSAPGDGPITTEDGPGTTGDGTTASGTTANDTTANDTDGPPTDQYVACEDPVCDNGCVTFNHFEVCAIPCTTVGAPCAIHVDTDDGQYPLTCASLFAPICVILCDSDADCPKGTTCTTDNPVAACMYPGR